MIEGGSGNPAFRIAPRQRNTASSQPPTPSSMSSSPSASSTTSDATTTIQIDPQTLKRFVIIVENWKQNSLTREDKGCLLATTFSVDEYIALTEELSLRHGVQLRNNHIVLDEYPTTVHEVTIGYIESVVIQTYPRTDIMNTRSTSMMFSSFHEC